MKKYIISNYFKQTGGNLIRNHINGQNAKNIKECIGYLNNNDIEKKQISKGNQGQIFLIQNNICGTIVIKHFENNKTFLKELSALIKLKKLILNNTCPNFIMYYGFDKFKDNIYLEYIDNDLKHIYDNFKINVSDEICKSFIFQILYNICQ